METTGETHVSCPAVFCLKCSCLRQSWQVNTENVCENVEAPKVFIFNIMRLHIFCFSADLNKALIFPSSAVWSCAGWWGSKAPTLVIWINMKLTQGHPQQWKQESCRQPDCAAHSCEKAASCRAVHCGGWLKVKLDLQLSFRRAS